MLEDRVVLKARQRVKNKTYGILVYRKPNGMYYAKTDLSYIDIIINDGASLDEAIKTHKRLLPLAVRCHQARKGEYESSPLIE